MAKETPSRAVYVISIAAELAGMHPQTLRIYERKGLIEPSRTAGRSRRYSEEDIAVLRHIQALTNDGLSLSGVKRVLDLEGELTRARRESDRLREQLQATMDEMRGALEAVHRTYRRDLVPSTSRLPVYRAPRRGNR